MRRLGTATPAGVKLHRELCAVLAAAAEAALGLAVSALVTCSKAWGGPQALVLAVAAASLFTGLLCG
jgi:hypothetical protein